MRKMQIGEGLRIKLYTNAEDREKEIREEQEGTQMGMLAQGGGSLNASAFLFASFFPVSLTLSCPLAPTKLHYMYRFT